jgi:hypothetical protein
MGQACQQARRSCDASSVNRELFRDGEVRAFGVCAFDNFHEPIKPNCYGRVQFRMEARYYDPICAPDSILPEAP